MSRAAAFVAAILITAAPASAQDTGVLLFTDTEQITQYDPFRVRQAAKK